MSKISISIIVPIYNEELVVASTLRDLIAALTDSTQSFQIVLVDDGSSDNSATKVLPFLRENIILVRSKSNRGIGGAFKLGMRNVTQPYVTWFPSDGEFPAAELVKMFPSIHPDYAVVSVPSNSKHMRSIFRYLLSKSFVILVSIIFGMRLRYYNGMSIYASGHVRDIVLHSHGFTFPLEILYKLSKKKIGFRQVEVNLQKRIAGKSKAINPKVLLDVFVKILKVRFL